MLSTPVLGDRAARARRPPVMATSLAHGAIVPRLDAVRPAAAGLKESRRGHRLGRSTPASFSFKPPIIPTPHGNTIAWAPQSVAPHHLRAVVGAPRAIRATTSRDRSGLITRARTDADRSGVGVGSGRRCSFRDGRLGSGRGGGPAGKGENTARASGEAEAGGGDGGEGGEGGGGGSGGGGGGSGGGGGDDEGDEEDAFKSLDEVRARS